MLLSSLKSTGIFKWKQDWEVKLIIIIILTWLQGTQVLCTLLRPHLEFVTTVYSCLPMFVLTTVDSLFSKFTANSKRIVSFSWLMSQCWSLCFPHLLALNRGGRWSGKLYDGSVIVLYSLLRGSYKERCGSVKRKRGEDKERKPRKNIHLLMNLFVQRLFCRGSPSCQLLF